MLYCGEGEPLRYHLRAAGAEMRGVFGGPGAGRLIKCCYFKLRCEYGLVIADVAGGREALKIIVSSGVHVKKISHLKVYFGFIPE